MSTPPTSQPQGSDPAAVNTDENLQQAAPGSPAEPDENELEEYEPLTPELVEEEALRGDIMLRWAVVLLAFLLGSTRIAESATLVHVKTGQYLAARGFWPPRHDVFSYTATDRAWINLSWGFDLVGAAIYALAGFAGLSLIKALLAAITFWIVGRISRPGVPTWWGSICAALALVACHERLAFQPTLVTLLGTALVLWVLHDWRQSGAKKRPLWLLVPLLFAWANFDSRAYLGLAVLILYAVGDALAVALQREGALSTADRKQLWLAIGASVVAMLLNPFGWHSLQSPWHIYGVEYRAFREYISGAYLGTSNAVAAGAMYFPMTNPAFRQRLDLAGLAGLVSMGICLATFVLNIRRIDLGHMLVFAGFALFAVLAVHELPVASLVCAVIATLNGQAWYAENCRQTYSVDPRELAFSKGGRAVTVVALALLGLFMGTGRLRGNQEAATGFGLEEALAVELNDLASQLGGDKSYDHRPFNFRLQQGDKLIWVGEQVFADSRVGVYFSGDLAHNLLAEHAQTREQLLPASGAASAGETIRRAAISNLAFNEHGVTHIVPQLSMLSSGIIDDLWLLSLARNEQRWQLTSLGPTAAVFYRIDADTRAVGNVARYDSFLESHLPDFSKRAFREAGEPILRRGWARPPSFYQRYLWPSRMSVEPEVQEAAHLVWLALNPLPEKYGAGEVAMACLAIRQAQAGLAKNPEAVLGYLVLGQAYEVLMRVESADISPPGSMPTIPQMRYLQAVAAYHQALVADPDNALAHFGLVTLFGNSQPRPTDLLLRHLAALVRLWERDPRIPVQQREGAHDAVASLQQMVEQAQADLAQLPLGEDRRVERAQYAQQHGCVLEALKELDAEASQTRNLPAELQRVRLLIESGRLEDAQMAAELIVEPARAQPGLPDWESLVAVANLIDGDYERACEMWSEAAETLDRTAFTNSVQSLALKSSGLPWPISAVQAAENYMYARPQAVSRVKLHAALVRVEEGLLYDAQRLFEESLAANPETPARRLIRDYLFELTDEVNIEPFPPSETVPGLFAPEPGEEDSENPAEKEQ